jgi:hypothetical protein
MLHNVINENLFFDSGLHISFTDPIVTTDSANIIIPFSRAGNLILLRAKADTAEGNFILDTGAPGLVLNITYFRNYTAHDKAGESGGITGAASTVLQTNVDSLSFGAVNYYKVEGDLVNLGHIENTKGIKILGLLGMQLFTKFEMIIDYEKSVIHLRLISRKYKDHQNEMLKDTAAYNTYPIELFENKILAYLYNGGKKLRFIIDTGAESNVLDSRLPNKVLSNVTVTGRVLLNGTSNRKIEALNGDLKNTKIGNQSLRSLPVLITNLEKMCYAYNACLDGMLGFDFLSLHKIGFNFVTKKMYIWK